MRQETLVQMYDKGIQLEIVPVLTGLSVEQYLDQVAALHRPIVQAVFAERIRQNALHPNFPAEIQLAVLMEEVGEVASELQALPVDRKHLISELIQVAAVALRMVEALRKESPV